MEEWRDIKNFIGYQVSNYGRVRSFWAKRHYPTGYGTYRYLSEEPHIMPLSDDGNGYMKVMLYCKADSKRYCLKVHKLVAEAFVPNNYEYGDCEYTVDHIKSGLASKYNNHADNLQWLSRSENIRKAYRDGMHDDRIRRSLKPIIAINLWTDEECYFSSIKEASTMLGIDRASISHVLLGDYERTGHYRFEYAGREENLLYGEESNQLFSWLQAGLR